MWTKVEDSYDKKKKKKILKENLVQLLIPDENGRVSRRGIISRTTEGSEAEIQLTPARVSSNVKKRDTLVLHLSPPTVTTFSEIVGMANHNTSFQLRGQLWYHCGEETFNNSSSPAHTVGKSQSCLVFSITMGEVLHIHLPSDVLGEHAISDFIQVQITQILLLQTQDSSLGLPEKKNKKNKRNTFVTTAVMVFPNYLTTGS